MRPAQHGNVGATPATRQRAADEPDGIHDLAPTALRRFLQVLDSELDEAIGHTLSDLGRTLAADRVRVLALAGDADDFDLTVTHVWRAPGAPVPASGRRVIPRGQIQTWLETLAAGEPVHVVDLAAVMGSRTVRGRVGPRSLVAAPLAARNTLHGVLSVDWIRSARGERVDEIEAVVEVGHAVAGALVRLESHRRSHEAEARLEALLRHAADLVVIVDADMQLAFMGPSWRRHGVEPVALIGEPWHAVIHPDDVARLEESTVAAMATEEARRGEPVDIGDFRISSTQERWFAGTATDLRTDPSIGGYVINAHDVTERRRAEAQLIHDALHDPLTGIANRVRFADRLDQACRRSATDDRPVAVLVIDLDRFNQINLGHGHETGDRILGAVASRLGSAVRRVDTVARFAADEFFVLLDGIDPAEIGATVHVVRESVAGPIRVGEETFRVTASVGAAVGSGMGLDPDTLLRDAETALHRAKRGGRDRTEWFDPAERDLVVRRAAVVHRLPTALAEDRIEVHFQPVVDVTTGRIVGAEALARWTDDHLGVVPPSEFVTVAEELGIVDRLGEHVLDVALSEVRRWPDRYHVSVNLSPAQLARADLDRTVRNHLRRHGVDPSRLWLEVTESMVLADPGRAQTTLQRLRTLGVRSALDDFGTGFSSLAMLRDLPIDVLKIDRRFVEDMVGDPRDRHLVATVVALARDFAMIPLAEGVETAPQHEALIDAGCAMAQGFLFARPMPADQIRALLRDEG